MDLKKICLGCMREKPQASGKCPYCGFDTKIYEYNNRWLPLEHIETEAATIPEGYWYYITSTYPKGIAVRSAPTGESEQIGRIPYGTEFCVREYKGDWGYTTVNGMTGWIELNYAAMLKETKSESWYQIISTYKKGIAVRSEATGESTELCRVPYGTVFYVEKTDRNWGYTTINGITGWIELSYAQAIEVGDTEPYSEKEILIN